MGNWLVHFCFAVLSVCQCWLSATIRHYLLYSWKLMPCMCASEQLQLCASEQKTAWWCWNHAFLSHAFLHQRGFQMKFWIFKDLCNYRLVDFFTTAAIHPLKSVLSLLLILALISPITPQIISTQKLDCEEIQVALQREKQRHRFLLYPYKCFSFICTSHVMKPPCVNSVTEYSWIRADTTMLFMLLSFTKNFVSGPWKNNFQEWLI